ncbi:MAG: hypothetical protein ABFS17_14220 [Chloroflexota bacterium]
MVKNKKNLIGIVGPCKAGKTALKRRLEAEGLTVRHIAQEHSYVKEMWKKISNPDLLIYLDVSYETTLLRSSLGWSKSEYQEQLRRLSHARENADLVIDTNHLNPDQISKIVLEFLNERQAE